MERFGERRYKFAFDPCYSSFNVPRESLDPWMMTIPCEVGHIYPFGDRLLAIDIEGHCRMRGMVKRLACTELHTEGDADICCLFDVANIDQVAKLVKPKRRRQYTDEQRAEMTDRLRAYQYPFRSKTPPDGSRTASKPPTRTSGHVASQAAV